MGGKLDRQPKGVCQWLGRWLVGERSWPTTGSGWRAGESEGGRWISLWVVCVRTAERRGWLRGKEGRTGSEGDEWEADGWLGGSVARREGQREKKEGREDWMDGQTDGGRTDGWMARRPKRGEGREGKGLAKRGWRDRQPASRASSSRSRSRCREQTPRAAPPVRGGRTHLMPVSGPLVQLHLLLHPLQVGLQEALEPLAVTDFVLEGATVIHHRVHPVHVDELWGRQGVRGQVQGGRAASLARDPADSPLGLRLLNLSQASENHSALVRPTPLRTRVLFPPGALLTHPTLVPSGPNASGHPPLLRDFSIPSLF